jgi:hypothetical protein
MAEKDVEFLRRYYNQVLSDCSFQSNSFETIVSIYQTGIIYSLTSTFYSVKTMSTGFICPGRRFRQFWAPDSIRESRR